MRRVCEVVSTIENLCIVQKFIEDYSETIKLSSKTTCQIMLCIEEIFVNIINYAYKTKGIVQIVLDSNSEEIIVEIIDKGIEYNPLTAKEPNLDIPLLDREIGGLGIYITKKNMDKITYLRSNEKNILTLIKKIKEV